jgi:hypothetical protein
MESGKRILLLLMVAFWVGHMDRVVHAARICEDVCTGGGNCDKECWLTQFDFDQGYPATTCGDQSYSCCGDGMCDTGTEYCGYCTADCGDSYSCDNECTWSFQCSSGLVCNSSHQCVTPSPNTGGGGGTDCANKTDCEGNDVCAETDCAIPHDDYCPSSQDCQYTPCPEGQYCDPGIVRCQYVNGFDCPPG